MNLKFKVIDAEVDEVIYKNEKSADAVKRLSLAKLEKAKDKVRNGIIISADTIVVLGNKVLGKPKNKKDAVRILKMLSGKTHVVYTGYSIYNSAIKKTITDFEKTEVTFRNLTQEEISDYVESGSPLDKAGAYGIQDDFGAVFVKKINGCYYNVVGLPLSKLYSSLLRITIID